MVLGVKVLCEVVCQVFLAWVPLHVEGSVLDLVCHRENLISIERERCFFTLSFAIPVAGLLSQWTVVGGCLWTNYSNVSLR